MSSIKQRTEAIAPLVLFFLAMLFAVRILTADVEEWKSTFKLAESVINTKSERDAIPIFRKVIGEISSERAKRPLTPEESALLQKALDHLAQAFFNSNEMAKANETFLQLIDVNPDYKMNEDLVSPKIIQMFTSVKQQNLGTLNLRTTPADAAVQVDGQAFQANNGAVFLKQGNHELKVSKPGFEPSTQTVTVTAGSQKDLNVELKAFSDAVAVLLTDRPEVLQSYQNAVTSGDKNKIAVALEQAGNAVYEEKKLPEAQKIYEQALAGARETGDQALAAKTLMDLGDLLRAKKDFAGAQSRYGDALAAYQQAQNKDGAISATLLLGDLLQLNNDSAGAIKNYEAGLVMLKEKGDKPALAATLYKLGNIRRAQKDPQARANYQEALALFQELNDAQSVSKVQMSLEDLRTDEKYRTVSVLNQATALLNQGSYVEAERKFTEALTLAKEIDAKDNAASALLNIGYIISGQGKHAEAKPKYEEALALSRETGNKTNQALALYDLAVTAFNLQDTVQANSLYDQSAAIYKELGESPRPKPW